MSSAIGAGSDPSGTITFVVDKNSITTGNIFSPEIEVGGMQWALCITHVVKDADHLGVYLCLRDGEYNVWTVDVAFEIKIINKDDRNTVSEKQRSTFYKLSDRGFRRVVSWDDLMNVGKGFIKDDKITVQCKFSLSNIIGFRKRHKIDFSDPNEPLNDMTLLIGEEKVYVNTQFLSFFSPYFRTLFSDAVDKKKKEVVIENVIYKEFIELLHVITPPSNKQITDDNVYFLLKLADRFSIDAVSYECELFLIKSTKLTVTSKVLLADKYSLYNLMMDVDPATDGSAPAEPAPAPASDEKPKTTTKTVAIELPIVETLPTTVDTEKFTKAEEEMQRADLMEKKKADAKNAVEEYVYEMRDKLCDQLGEYITEADADNLRAQLQSTEDWLYDEGEDCETAVYEQRLASLRALGDPVVERYREAGQRMGAFDRLNTTILRARKACDDYAANGPAHAHIDAKDMEKVLNAVEEKKRWVDEARHKQETRPKTDAPAVFVHEVIGQITQFENVVNPILNRAKPKVEPPKAPETAKTENPEGAADAPAGSQEQAEMEMD